MAEALPGELPLAGEEGDFSGNENRVWGVPCRGTLVWNERGR